MGVRDMGDWDMGDQDMGARDMGDWDISNWDIGLRGMHGWGAGGVQAHLGPWPLTKNLLAMGLKDGPKWA